VTSLPANDIVGDRRAGRGLTGLLLVAIPVILVCWMVIWPIISAITRTVWLPDASGERHFSLETYSFFFSDGYSLNNLLITLWTTAVSMLLLLVICLPIALYLRFANGRLAAYVQSLAILPMFVPSIILSYAFIRVLGTNGTVDLVLNALHYGLSGAIAQVFGQSDIGNWLQAFIQPQWKIRSPYLTAWGPVIGLVWDNIPLTVLILLSGLGAVSNASIEAARDVGAGNFAVLWYIILPRILNSLLVAVSFTVLGIFSAFTLPYVLGPAAPEMMGPYMQRTFRDLNDPTTAITQAVIAFAFCIVFGLFYVYSVARNRAP
jgi:putative spermidine/putrescine transport system permease protein